MHRIAIVQLGFESNTFVSGRAGLVDLAPDGWIPGSTVISRFKDSRTGIGGILATAEEAGAAAVPMDLLSRNGAFNAGCIIDGAFWEESVAHICDELRERATEYDGVCVSLHGAGVADGHDDADGYFLRRVREAVGSKPITAFLDLHAIITPEMVAMTDALFGVKTYPHVDYFETGTLAARTLLGMLDGTLRPVMAFRPLPLLVPVTFASTLDGVAKEIREYTADYARQHGLIDATFFHGFSAIDTAYTCACVLAVCDGRTPDREADELARHIWSLRDGFLQPIYSASEAIDAALAAVRDGYAVINDCSDNPGAGCPGDGTHLLREMIRRDLPRSIFGVIYDPAAAALCHLHQPGDRFPLEVGGHTEAVFGDPLQLEVELLALWDGNFVCASPMYQDLPLRYGPSARLRCGQVEFIVVSLRMQSYDDRPILMTGGNMRDYDLVALKSSNHFRAYFRNTADAIITADTPSALPADLRKLDYRHVPRPVYPLNEDTAYEP